MTGEPGSAAPSNVTVCSTGSRLVQRTACPAEMVMASPANFTAVMLTSAATAAPDAAEVNMTAEVRGRRHQDRKSTRLNSSHGYISYAVFCLKKKKNKQTMASTRRKKTA